MKKFQYRMDEFDKSEEKDLHKQLTTLGEKGWELVSVVQSQGIESVHTFYFKREIKEKKQ